MYFELSFTRFTNHRSDERGLSRKHIVESVKASLARLQMEYIDVVLLHKVDPVCPMEGERFHLPAQIISEIVLVYVFH